ncbi:MAG: DEAD/DEAH box helicase family protein [Moorella humiferrea]|nr:DEAD/DEAH box helicase family protein [Moorella humiferrea]
MLPHTYVVLDVETTGLDPNCDQIIEIAAIRLEKGQITGRLHTLINPGRSIPPHIQKLTGIDDAMVRHAPSLTEVLPHLLDLMGDAIPAGHNGQFDLAFLNKAFGNSSWHRPLLDTLTLSRILYPCLPSYRLEFLSQKFAFAVNEHHRAMEDVLATVQLLDVLWKATLGLKRKLLTSMVQLAPEGLKQWFQAALMAESTPVAHEEAAAAGLFAVAASLPKSPVPDFGTEDIVAFLAPGGPLAEKIPNYEYRPQQAEMLRSVVNAFAENRYLIIEAGTGTGKTLAYLMPAVYWACHSGKKVAIATHTISLQEQLWHKDLPLLKEVLPFSFKATLVKGRNNYLCLRKLRDYQNNPPSGREERNFILRVLRWLEFTTSGDWSEMKLKPEEEVFKQSLAADKDTCVGNSCPFYDGCFVTRARLEAETADILILNHSLLLSDVRFNNQILPDYPYLIIDEAHHLEEVAAEHLGLTVSQAAGNFYLRYLGDGNNISFLGRIRALAARLDRQDKTTFLLSLLNDLEKNVTALEGEWQRFWECLADLNSVALWENNNGTLRFTPRLQETPSWDNLLSIFGQLEESINALTMRLERLSELLSAFGAEEMAASAANLKNLFAQYCHDIGDILTAEPEKAACWLEKTPTNQYILRSAPLEIGTILADMLFSHKQSVVLTSATLTVANNFDFYKEQVGINNLIDRKIDTCQVASPFDYTSQALVCAVKGLPNPGQLNDSAYAEAITAVIAACLHGINGRTLILCTSHRFLQDLYKHLSLALSGSDFSILAQGIDGGRAQLLEEFRQTSKAVLLGANTYWEGIDLPGELLKCVIIPRLPFPSPGIPLLAARMENAAAKGKNPFTTLCLPQAIIRFRQGFGRLIRTAKDRGVMLVLDQRLLSQRYGRHFLQSLPPVTTAVVTPAELPEKLTSWLNAQ